MGDLVDVLADRGFRAVETPAPGGWATDGEVSLRVETEHGPHGLGPHTVTVFAGPPDAVDVTEALAYTSARSHNRAIRQALEAAGIDDPDDRDGAGEVDTGP